MGRQRPKGWKFMTATQKSRWRKEQETSPNGKKKAYKHLKAKHKEKVWELCMTHDNNSEVAELLGVGRSSLYRFLEKFPVPSDFTVEDDFNDYEEIKYWRNRQKGYSKKDTIAGYLGQMRAFYRFMLKHHPDRARPKLWSSDLIIEWVYGNEDIKHKAVPKYLQHDSVVALRQLGLKAPLRFPFIDCGALPTRKTAKQRRSLAGVKAYYLEWKQTDDMIENVPADTEFLKLRNQSAIKLLRNLAIRTGKWKTGLGLLGLTIEDFDFSEHMVIAEDKCDIYWHCYGLADDTIETLKKYLAVRGNPQTGPLLVTEKGIPWNAESLNKMLKKAGEKAGIQGKNLTCKTFRKTLVKYALTPRDKGGLGMNPISLIGTGKEHKTCFCVGWTSMKVLMEHYAPQLMDTINKDRQRFDGKEPDLEGKLEKLKKACEILGINIGIEKITALFTLMGTL